MIQIAFHFFPLSKSVVKRTTNIIFEHHGHTNISLFSSTGNNNAKGLYYSWFQLDSLKISQFVAEGFLAAAAAKHLESKQTWKKKIKALPKHYEITASHR